MGKFCSQCGTRLGENALFCHECGTKRQSDLPSAVVPEENKSATEVSKSSVEVSKNTVSDRVIPLVLGELYKGGSLPDYNSIGRALLKLKQQEPSPKVDVLLKIAEAYRTIGDAFKSLAMPLPGTPVVAGAMAGGMGASRFVNGGIGAVSAVNGNTRNGSLLGVGGGAGGGTISTGQSPANSENSAGGWKQFAGMAAAGFAGSMLAHEINRMRVQHQLEELFHTDESFDYNGIDLMDYLSAHEVDSPFYEGLSPSYLDTLSFDTSWEDLAIFDDTDNAFDYGDLFNTWDEGVTADSLDATEGLSNVIDSAIGDDLDVVDGTEITEVADADVGDVVDSILDLFR